MIEERTIKTPMGSTKKYFYNSERPAEYRRIAGGVAWPSSVEGFIVVVGEDYHEDPALKIRHFRVLDEFESDDVIKKMYDFRNVYKVQNFYGDSNNEIMMKFISRFNEKLDKRKKGMYLSEAPFVNDPHNLKYYAPQIRKRLDKAKKALWFGNESQLPRKIRGLTSVDVDISSHPAIAALGYAVAGLDEPYFDYTNVREMQDIQLNNYNVAGL